MSFFRGHRETQAVELGFTNKPPPVDLLWTFKAAGVNPWWSIWVFLSKTALSSLLLTFCSSTVPQCVLVVCMCGWVGSSGLDSWGVFQRPQWPCLSEKVGPYRAWGEKINRPWVLWRRAGFTMPLWPSFKSLSLAWHLSQSHTRWTPPPNTQMFRGVAYSHLTFSTFYM